MINEKQQTLAELISLAEVYFKTLSYSSARMRTFWIGWQALDEYMKDNSIGFYNPMVGGKFIESILGSGQYTELSRLKKDIIRSNVFMIPVQKVLKRN